MSKRKTSPAIGRRNFIKGAGLLGAAALTPAQAQAQAAAPKARLKAAPPGPIQMAAETQAPTRDSVSQSSSGGDFMVDVFKDEEQGLFIANITASTPAVAPALRMTGQAPARLNFEDPQKLRDEDLDVLKASTRVLLAQRYGNVLLFQEHPA